MDFCSATGRRTGAIMLTKTDVSLEKYSEGDPSELVLVHIGKCGGSTLRRAVQRSSVVEERFSDVRFVHVRKPRYQQNPTYLFALRNPISRSLSAFNWRKKLVVETKKHEFRFSGEFDVLVKYGNLNALAESLYSGDVVNLEAMRDWLTIHHLKEDIAFYLRDLLPPLREDQIFGVVSQESLNDDLESLLGVANKRVSKRNNDAPDPESLYLSERAKENMRKFLIADYDAIRLLSTKHQFDPLVLEKLLA